MWDVTVVGAGPGGSAAAKLCAEAGLKTLVLEKKKLPRDKVCSGLLSGKVVMRLVHEIFGELPETVLIDPFYLKGAIIRVDGADPKTIKERMPTAWRKDLDYWMIQRAREQGVKVFDSAGMMGIAEEKGIYEITVQHEGKKKRFKTRFIIGADGAVSSVRKALYPGFKIRYKQAIRECYRGTISGLDRQYIHIFPDPSRKMVFLVNHKGDSFTLEISGRPGEIKALRDTMVKPFLAAHYGFDPMKGFQWRDGCAEAMLSRDLISGSFIPARGNILLVGDAAGFQLPTAEGIGTALRSAFIAVSSIIKATRQEKAAATIYIKEVRGMIEAIKTLRSRGQFDLSGGPEVVAAAIKDRLLGVLELNYLGE